MGTLAAIGHRPGRKISRFGAVLLALALSLTACSSEGGTAAAPVAETTVTQAPTNTTVAEPTQTSAPAPAPAGLLADVEAEFQSWSMSNGLPGAVLAVRIGGESLDSAYGVGDLLLNDPVSPESAFRLGSVTKVVTTGVILTLVDEGLLSLDTAVSEYLPGWETLAGPAGAGEVTVRQLLDHTAGFSDYAVDPLFYVEALSRLDVASSPEEVIAFSLEQGLLFAPGSDYSYSTTNYLVLGQLIEEITGNPAEVEFHGRVLQPLGLEHLFLTPGESGPDPVVNGYIDLRSPDPESDFAGLTDLLDVFSGLLPAGSVVELEDGTVVDVGALPQEFLNSVGWTGGGIEGRVSDAVELIPGLFNSGILSEVSVSELQTPSSHHDRSVGLDVRSEGDYTVYSLGGAVPGYRSAAAYVPELDLAVAVSANAVPLADDVHDLIASIAEFVAGGG